MNEVLFEPGEGEMAPAVVLFTRDERYCRGFCPSCGGKRMTRFAGHLIDHVTSRRAGSTVGAYGASSLALPHGLRPRRCRAVHRALILGRAFIRAAQSKAPNQILESADIHALGLATT